MEESGAESDPFGQRQRASRVPSWLGERGPVYDWSRPVGLPKLFAADPCAPMAKDRLLADDDLPWCRLELASKLRRTLPALRNNKTSSEEREQSAAASIQKQWKLLKDQSSGFADLESKLTREFGHPEDSLDLLLKNPSISNQKSLTELLIGFNDTDDTRGRNNEIGNMPSDDLLCIEDEVQLKEYHPNFSRRLSTCSSLGDEIKKNRTKESLNTNDDTRKSAYSFAFKEMDQQDPKKSPTGSSLHKQKRLNAIKFVPSLSNRSSISSGVLKNTKSQPGNEFTIAEQDQHDAEDDDLIFRSITLEQNRSELDNSYMSQPSFLEETLIVSLTGVELKISIQPFFVEKIFEIFNYYKPQVVLETKTYEDDLYILLSDLPRADETGQKTVAIEPSEQEASIYRCYATNKSQDVNELMCHDFSIEIPPNDYSVVSALQQTGAKNRQEKNLGKKGKNKEIEIVFLDEQELPRIEVACVAEPYYASVGQIGSAEEVIEKKNKLGIEVSKNNDIPLVRNSGSKKLRKECLACQQSVHAGACKSNRQNERKATAFGKTIDRKFLPQSTTTSPAR
jgi:hypothetical protein